MNPTNTSSFAQAAEQHRAGNLPEAYRLYRLAAAEDAGNAEAWKQMGLALIASKKDALAIGCLRKSLALRADWETSLQLGQALIHLSRYSEAEPHLLDAVEGNPDISMTYYSLAYYAMMFGKIDMAHEAIAKAYAIDPNVPDIPYLMACLHLRCGEWEKGFSFFESRLILKPQKWQVAEPVWNGEDLTNKTIHVLSEQGFGDVLLFSRFLALLPARRILFMAPAEMKSLFEFNIRDPRVTVYGLGSPPPLKADFWTPVASIPRYCLRGDELPVSQLTAPPGSILQRPAHIQKTIGIVWAGDPKHPNDAHRSSRLEDFVHALALPGFELYSLQVGGGEVDSALLGPMGIVQALPISNFADTANWIDQLDTVVTVDTSVANLCGAMGKEAHVLIPFGGVDWRWMREGERTPWFPSLRLWRQQENQPWSELLVQVADFLQHN